MAMQEAIKAAHQPVIRCSAYSPMGAWRLVLELSCYASNISEENR